VFTAASKTVNARRQLRSANHIPVIGRVDGTRFRFLKGSNIVLRNRRVPPPAQLVERDAQIGGSPRIQRIVGLTALLGKNKCQAGFVILLDHPPISPGVLDHHQNPYSQQDFPRYQRRFPPFGATCQADSLREFAHGRAVATLGVQIAENPFRYRQVGTGTLRVLRALRVLLRGEVAPLTDPINHVALRERPTRFYGSRICRASVENPQNPQNPQRGII
jgi:hypothetical protein